jgi:signal-transduction protein with cAMP-binding, CBS, and nucleotidyltransferase domain
MSESLKSVLIGVPLFAGLEESGYDLLANGARVSSLASGHIIIQEGQAGRQLFIIRAGTVQVFRNTNHGEVVLSGDRLRHPF